MTMTWYIGQQQKFELAVITKLIRELTFSFLRLDNGVVSLGQKIVFNLTCGYNNEIQFNFFKSWFLRVWFVLIATHLKLKITHPFDHLSNSV
jgi:hypothetical protein